MFKETRVQSVRGDAFDQFRANGTEGLRVVLGPFNGHSQPPGNSPSPRFFHCSLARRCRTVFSQDHRQVAQAGGMEILSVPMKLVNQRALGQVSLRRGNHDGYGVRYLNEKKL